MALQDTERKNAQRLRMAVLSRADGRELSRLWMQVGLDPECELVRGPETGLVTLRGRIGGGGAPFNFGEATVTRATVRLGSGAIGHSVMLGRDARKAKLAAVIDALACDEEMEGRIDRAIVAPLRALQAETDERRRAEAAATKVDFFTMVRGED